YQLKASFTHCIRIYSSVCYVSYNARNSCDGNYLCMDGLRIQKSHQWIKEVIDEVRCA
ncbi:hypothetical protein LEMLEM_LOCUS6832, partial [Lemmus lemmus]